MKTYFAKALILLLLPLVCLSVAADEKTNPSKLRVALLPDENASTIIKNNLPLKQHLENVLDSEIKLVVTADYSSMVEAMRFGRIDVAYFGPLSYVMAKSKSNIEAFCCISKNGNTTYRSIIITRADSGISRIEDLRGKDVAFGDPASTSSSLIPKFMLLNTGLQIKRDYSGHHVGSHDAVALMVQNGKAHAGGLSKPIFDTLVEKGIIDSTKVRIIKTSGAYPQYPWTMRSDLDSALKERIRNAFLDIKDKNILKSFKATGFSPVNDADYDIVRELAKTLELDLSQ